MSSHAQQAQTLVEALPYIQKFRNSIMVVKFGGSAMEDEELVRGTMRDIVMLEAIGIRPVIVHGGGKAISAEMAKANIEPRFINGLRYTDEETMDIVQQILCGKVNKSLVSIINNLGGKAIGLCGMDGGKCGEDIVERITKRVNGGLNGIAQRKYYYRRFKKELGL